MVDEDCRPALRAVGATPWWITFFSRTSRCRFRFPKHRAGVQPPRSGTQGPRTQTHFLRLRSPETSPVLQLVDEWSTFPLYDQVGYDQPLRPQFHFTSRMGWLNDPNGMVYYDGEWHMLFQHHAKGNASGAKVLGQCAEHRPRCIGSSCRTRSIRTQKSMGRMGVHAIWSGSAVVDVNNAHSANRSAIPRTLVRALFGHPREIFSGWRV